MKGLYTVLLLVCSNIFMTFAWYGHLKLQEMKVINNWPLIGVILISWGMAFFEYSLQIPGNRIGFQGNGGPFIFAIFTMIFFQGETLKWNHLAAGVCLVMAVYFVFMK